MYHSNTSKIRNRKAITSTTMVRLLKNRYGSTPASAMLALDPIETILINNADTTVAFS